MLHHGFSFKKNINIKKYKIVFELLFDFRCSFRQFTIIFCTYQKNRYFAQILLMNVSIKKIDLTIAGLKNQFASRTRYYPHYFALL